MDASQLGHKHNIIRALGTGDIPDKRVEGETNRECARWFDSHNVHRHYFPQRCIYWWLPDHSHLSIALHCRIGTHNNVSSSELFKVLAIAVGRAGCENSLPTFWNQQLNDPINQQISYEKHCTSVECINISLWLYVLGTYILSSIKSWTTTFEILIVVMAIATIIILCGTLSYIHLKPCGSTCVVHVFVAATLKRHHQCPSNTSQLHNPEAVELPLPNTNQLRFLEKASIIVLQGVNDKESKWRLCTVTEVEETKLLLGMFPMCTTFLMSGVVLSVGNTYFLEQGNSMESKLGKIQIPILSFLLLFEVSRVVTTKIYSLTLSSCTRLDETCLSKLRLGVGMLLSVNCCVVAALVETKRLNVISSNGLLHEPGATVLMSMFWLTPQFLLLGATDGLVKDGVRQLSQLNEDIRRTIRQHNDWSRDHSKYTCCDHFK
ncbi:hypothetical protein IFM89_023347 [Coptis chinensis]|uniref:Uncharacterized protein n=1 Tax=Coptis chinensis TaxID=261450 RepID=A0A835HLI3_9MAGN|nr:hypothetical protein IFM89_023347 [Coptis chinensis]